MCEWVYFVSLSKEIENNFELPSNVNPDVYCIWQIVKRNVRRTEEKKIAM